MSRVRKASSTNKKKLKIKWTRTKSPIFPRKSSNPTNRQHWINWKRWWRRTRWSFQIWEKRTVGTWRRYQSFGRSWALARQRRNSLLPKPRSSMAQKSIRLMHKTLNLIRMSLTSKPRSASSTWRSKTCKILQRPASLKSKRLTRHSCPNWSKRRQHLPLTSPRNANKSRRCHQYWIRILVRVYTRSIPIVNKILTNKIKII